MSSEALGSLCTRRPLAVLALRRLGFDVDDPARSIASTCELLGVDAVTLDAVITAEEQRLARLWTYSSTAAQIDALVRTYHQPLADEARAVETAFANGIPIWDAPLALFAELNENLAHHIEMEESVLFPLLRRSGSSVLSVIRALSLEHEDLVAELLAIGAASRACAAATPDAGIDAMQTFTRFERLVCESIHIETQLLFPRVLEIARR